MEVLFKCISNITFDSCKRCENRAYFTDIPVLEGSLNCNYQLLLSWFFSTTALLWGQRILCTGVLHKNVSITFTTVNGTINRDIDFRWYCPASTVHLDHTRRHLSYLCNSKYPTERGSGGGEKDKQRYSPVSCLMTWWPSPSMKTDW